jgi:hypothetical protein
MADTYNNDNWRERIDTDVRGLSEDVAGVKAEVKGLANSFDNFSVAFERISLKQQEFSKPNYIVVFGISTIGITIVLALIGGWTSGYLRDLNRVESQVEVIRSQRISENDPKQDIQLKDLEEEVLAIRLNEHKDIAIDASNQAKLESLMSLKEDFHNHRKDGHPQRIEELLNTRSRVFETFREDFIREADKKDKEIARRLLQIEELLNKRITHELIVKEYE